MRKFIYAALGVLALAVGVPSAVSQDVRNTYIAVAAQIADAVIPKTKLATSALDTTTSAEPSPASVPGDPALAFAGPSNSPFRYMGRLTGTSAGTPATGYQTNYAIFPVQTEAYITTGHNQSTSTADGRTMAGAQWNYVIMQGQGDASNWLCGGYVNNNTPLVSTNWLADPALTCLAGQIDATSDSVNVAGIELRMRDAGFETTLSGVTMHLNRDAQPSPNTKKYTTVNFGATSDGAFPVDAFYYGTGKSKVGYDLTSADLSSTTAAFTTAANQYWFLNATNTSPLGTPEGIVPGNTYLGYQSASSGVVIVNNSVPVVRFHDYGFVVPSVPIFASALSAATGTPNSICQNDATKEITVNPALTCTVSSLMFKHDFAPIDKPATPMLMAMQPGSFFYNDGGTRQRLGFGAEYMAAVDHRLADGWDVDGKPRSIDQNAILAVVVKAFQELKANNDNLRSRLERIEAR